jgi:hypothetical protein
VTVASIIIPTHNRDTLLMRAVNSALAQSVEDIEVIVVNDASTDQTREVLAIFEGMDPRLKVLDLTQAMGISGGLQRNEGVKAAQGAFICYLDDDDEYTYRAVEHRVGFLRANPEVDFCWGASLFLRNWGPDEWKYLCRVRLVTEPTFGDIQWQYGTVIPNELMHRAGVVGESGIWWTQGRGEDQRLVSAMLGAEFVGAPVNEVVALYGRHNAYDKGMAEMLGARVRAADKERLAEAGVASTSVPVPAPARMPEDLHGKVQARSHAASLRTEATPVAVSPVRGTTTSSTDRR